MIIGVKCSNFYSIGDDVFMDYTVGNHAPKTHLFKTLDVAGYSKRISLVNTIIGPNASGKTSLLTILDFLKHMIVDSLNDPADIGMFNYTPNERHNNDPSYVSVKFSIDKRIFEYILKFDRLRIIQEKIVEYKLATKRFSATTLFYRFWNKKNQRYDMQDKVLNLSPTELRSNASVISVAKQLPKKYPFAKLIADYWQDNIIIHGLNQSSLYRFQASRQISIFDNPLLDKILDDERLNEKVSRFLSRYDIGYESIQKEKISFMGQTSKDMPVVYYMVHHYENADMKISWINESNGTKHLVSLLADVALALLKTDCTVVVDELDSFLHPDIVEDIIGQFADQTTNPNSSQIIFSTHHHRILSSLSKQQIFLSEKNNCGETEVWRLDDEKNVRADENYYIKYIEGAYRAKPKIVK